MACITPRCLVLRRSTPRNSAGGGAVAGGEARSGNDAYSPRTNTSNTSAAREESACPRVRGRT
eukprot:1451909-Pyramimonas_sp.AAC.1